MFFEIAALAGAAVIGTKIQDKIANFYSAEKADELSQDNKAFLQEIKNSYCKHIHLSRRHTNEKGTLNHNNTINVTSFRYESWLDILPSSHKFLDQIQIILTALCHYQRERVRVDGNTLLKRLSRTFIDNRKYHYNDPDLQCIEELKLWFVFQLSDLHPNKDSIGCLHERINYIDELSMSRFKHEDGALYMKEYQLKAFKSVLSLVKDTLSSIKVNLEHNSACKSLSVYLQEEVTRLRCMSSHLSMLLHWMFYTNTIQDNQITDFFRVYQLGGGLPTISMNGKQALILHSDEKGDNNNDAQLIHIDNGVIQSSQFIAQFNNAKHLHQAFKTEDIIMPASEAYTTLMQMSLLQQMLKVLEKILKFLGEKITEGPNMMDLIEQILNEYEVLISTLKHATEQLINAFGAIAENNQHKGLHQWKDNFQRIWYKNYNNFIKKNLKEAESNIINMRASMCKKRKNPQKVLTELGCEFLNTMQLYRERFSRKFLQGVFSDNCIEHYFRESLRLPKGLALDPLFSQNSASLSPVMTTTNVAPPRKNNSPYGLFSNSKNTTDNRKRKRTEVTNTKEKKKYKARKKTKIIRQDKQGNEKEKDFSTILDHIMS